MPIFIAIPLKENSSDLNNAIKSSIAELNRHQLQADRGWLIKYDGTTIELSNHIGITGQSEGIPSSIGSAIVAPISGYYGRGSLDMWEWLRVRFEQ